MFVLGSASDLRCSVWELCVAARSLFPVSVQASLVLGCRLQSPCALQLWSVGSVVIVQWLSPVQLFATPWTAARQASLSITISRSLLKLMSFESVMPSNDLTLCHPLFLLLSIFLSIRVFSNESALRIRWPKYQSFRFSIRVFRIDFLQDGLVGSPYSPRASQESSPAPQFKSINSQTLSLLYGPTLTSITQLLKKTTTLTKWTFVDNVMSLLFNALFSFVIACLPSSRRVLISWLKSPYAVILEPRKIMSVTLFIVAPSICHEVMGLDAMILIF